MAEDYTPTTAEVRAAWIRSHRWPDGSRLRGHDESLGEQFDRWLAAHDREVRAQALRDAADESERLGTNAHAWLRDRADAEERGE